VKKYNNDFKGKQEVYLQLEKKLKSALGAYAMKKEAEARKLREELEAKAKADLEKAQKEAEKKGLPAPIAQDLAPILPPEPEQTVRTEAGKVTYKDAYCFEVEDANKMPLKYRKQVFALAVEKGLVDRVVRDALKEGVTEIEGVRIWKEKQVASSI
jgi:thiamine pyrophosphate-dependent acetolactate synthase large subunit-like protein